VEGTEKGGFTNDIRKRKEYSVYVALLGAEEKKGGRKRKGREKPNRVWGGPKRK